ncbi:S9 family peptidase [Propionicimonas sp.]|uniref:S9 family peptidase n=1 Tax=Propionicimonas sp. TaxID=1955623 RepID=UPI0039E68FCC
MRAEHLPLLNSPSAPAVHPDGTHAVVSVVRPDLDADAYVGQLWRVALTGDRDPLRITRGFRDTSPKFSPDGRILGFLRAGPDGPPQVALVPAGGGEPLVVTDARLGVCAFAFSADGTRLAFTAPVPEPGRYGTTEGVTADHEDPRLTSSLQFQFNGSGYLADRRAQVFVLDVPDPHGEPPVRPVGRAAAGTEPFRGVPEARQISSGDVDHHGPVWDGGQVVVAASRHDTRDTDLRVDLYRFDPRGGEPTLVTDSAAGDSVIGSPVVAGENIYFIGGHTGPDGRMFFARNPGVFVVPRAGGPVRRLTDAESMHAQTLVADGDGVLSIDLVRGRGVPFRVDADGAQLRWDLPGSVVSLGSGGGARVAVRADATGPGELVLLDPLPQNGAAAGPGPSPVVAAKAGLRPLTHFASALQQAATPIVPLELVATAPDGYPVHGWVVTPDGEGPHPVLVLIHGGPFAAFGPSYFDEAQVYAGAGYAVVMCNPRGSAGYGQAHAGAILGAFGDRDAVDVLAFLEHALAMVPGLAADRVGVMGGSYGGYLAAWLIAHEQRFRGAVVERGYLDPRSFIGPSDIGWYFADGCHGSYEQMDAQSPLLLVDRVRTPTLVIHSEQDLRCPIATSQRYFAELKRNGVEAELLIFPGENHELSRSGTPHHRRARFEHILRWWGRHLPLSAP